MDAHVDVETVEVLNSSSQLVEALDLPCLAPLVQDLEDLLDQLKGRLDLRECQHVACKLSDVGEQLGDDRDQLLALELDNLVHDDGFLLRPNTLLFDALQVVPVIFIVRNVGVKVSQAESDQINGFHLH